MLCDIHKKPTVIWLYLKLHLSIPGIAVQSVLPMPATNAVSERSAFAMHGIKTKLQTYNYIKPTHDKRTAWYCIRNGCDKIDYMNSLMRWFKLKLEAVVNRQHV